MSRRTKAPGSWPNLFLWLPFVALLCIGVIIAIGVMQQAPPTPNPNLGPKPAPAPAPDVIGPLRTVGTGDLGFARRHRLLVSYMEGADRLAKDVGDPRIQTLIEFLDAKAGATVPTTEGLLILSRYSKDDGLPVILLNQSDARFPQWAEFLRRTAGGLALYDAVGLKGIVIRTDEAYSAQWGALLLLHEASHAHRQRTQPFDATSLDLKVADEIRVHTEVNAWIEKVGGDRYQTLLMLEMARQADELKLLGKSVGEVLPQLGPYPPLMEDLFGPSKSNSEIRARLGQLFVHAQMRLAEKQGGDTKQKVFKLLYAQAKR